MLLRWRMESKRLMSTQWLLRTPWLTQLQWPMPTLSQMVLPRHLQPALSTRRHTLRY
jgi:hypothetical protein